MMGKRIVEGVLNCSFAGAYHGQGGRERQPLWVEILPAQDNQVVFSLPQACLARDLYRGPGAPRRPDPSLAWESAGGRVCSDELRRRAGDQWGRSVERFLEAAGLPASTDALGPPPPSLPRALLGGSVDDLVARAGTDGTGLGYASRVCCDIGLCVAVLSRCSGSVYLHARAPDYDWDRLFESVFWADAPGAPCEELAPVLRARGDNTQGLAWRCRREPGEAPE